VQKNVLYIIQAEPLELRYRNYKIALEYIKCPYIIKEKEDAKHSSLSFSAK
jgi:hypothetical protein